MKRYRGYFRAVILSVVAALAIDFVVNMDEYQAGWQAGFYASKPSRQWEVKPVVSEPQWPTKLARTVAVLIYQGLYK